MPIRLAPMPIGHMMDMVWLEDFVALERERSVSGAARLRNVTQPAFSRRVRALESWVGARLFDRSARGVALTAAGEVFARGAPELLGQMRALRMRTRDAGRGAVQTLRFAATQTLSFTFFPDFLRRADHLDLGHVQLNTANMATCEEIMRQGGAEFLLCHGHPGVAMPFAGDLPFRTVGRDRLVAVQGRRADGTAPVPQAGAGPWPYLAYGDATGIGRILAASEAELLRGVDRETVFTSHLSAALRQLACDGAGMAWLPLTLIADDLEAGRLQRLFDPARDIEIDILLFRASDLGDTAQLFWDSVREL